MEVTGSGLDMTGSGLEVSVCPSVRMSIPNTSLTSLTNLVRGIYKHRALASCDSFKSKRYHYNWPIPYYHSYAAQISPQDLIWNSSAMPCRIHQSPICIKPFRSALTYGVIVPWIYIICVCLILTIYDWKKLDKKHLNHIIYVVWGKHSIPVNQQPQVIVIKTNV